MEQVPYERDAQRHIARALATLTTGGRFKPSDTRSLVIDSWQRSLSASVHAGLREAPLVMTDDALADARKRSDWLPFAFRAAERLNVALAGGHILSLFDASGRMLACDGDPRALEGLARINFRPGALWAEPAVGTNGPGTALATGEPVHIVGAEHFCEAWHEWHCAAVPLRDETTGELLGAIDVSGFRDYAHPHTLDLSAALATSVQQMLAARESERRYAVLHRLAELSAAYGQEPMIAVDRGGRVLYATPSTPDGLRPGTVMPRALRDSIATHIRESGDANASRRVAEPHEVMLGIHDDVGVTALSHVVLDGHTAVGSCLLLRGGPGMRRHVSATPSGPSPVVTRASRAPVQTRYTFTDLVGTSPALAKARRTAAAAFRNDLPVLVLGESGTGKEVFAQAIHRASARHAQPFVAVNCASLPRELLETELFGYVGGAFTGAKREGSAGKFAAAQGGTIFLDEISELPPTAQASLLRVLQEREITAVGSAVSHSTDVRVIAATNRDIAESLASGQLRSDLYYRLNVLTLTLPPLRERMDDVPLLAQHFLDAAIAELNCERLTFGFGAFAELARHDWPGNVRELKNIIRRLAAMNEGPVITDAVIREALDGQRHGVVSRLTPETADTERARTLDVLASAPTMEEAASRLGVNRSTLYRRLARYGVRPSRQLHVQ